MGEIELREDEGQIIIRSHIITYGAEATVELTERMVREIETMWNAPAAFIYFRDRHYKTIFSISGECRGNIGEIDVLENTDPRNNYFRIENYLHGNISFVDGLGCNTGFFLLENLYEGSTTAAHEYGHTLGLDHPRVLDIRGDGQPGIMYPRGTLVDAPFQYDPAAQPGGPGGTMHPAKRVVRTEDIELLRLPRLLQNDQWIIGAFTSIYHWPHPRQ